MKIGIMGYGNLARGIIDNLSSFPDIELECVFSRREGLRIAYPTDSASNVEKYKDKIDVMIMCGGSATDLPQQSPQMAKNFNIVDSFDTHAMIPQHYKNVDEAARLGGHLACISAGWDPGLFSIARGYFNAFMPKGTDYTFWGKGVSQGHSDAIRRIEGVAKAVQYTVPKKDALEKARSGENPTLLARDKHLRECYVVAQDGADKAKIEQQIKSMPNYFADYDTIVNFISDAEFERDHKKMPHGGLVLRSGETAGNANLLELKIDLESNPHFTSSILLCYARAVNKMRKEGKIGCMTTFDVPLSAILPTRRDDLI